MSEVEKWQEIVGGTRRTVKRLKDKKEFYEREIEYYQQRLEEAGMMLNEARYLESEEMEE